METPVILLKKDKKHEIIEHSYERKRKFMSEEEKQKWQKFGFDDDSKSYRHIIKEIEMPIFSKVSNRVDVIFNGAIPLTGAV